MDLTKLLIPAEKAIIRAQTILRSHNRQRVLLPVSLLFAAGMCWAVYEMDITWSGLHWDYIGYAFLLLLPSIWLNAVELQLCAAATQNQMTLSQSLLYSNNATLANLLPLPGGAIVRGGALMKSGASLGASGNIVLATALLWLCLAGAITSLAVFSSPVGRLSTATLMLGVLVILFWISKNSGAIIAIGLFAIRILLLGLMVGRLYFNFLAIGADTSLLQSAVYTVASILGTAVGIVPAGLGVAESLGALLALYTNASPAEAFVSLGLSRLAGLIASAFVVVWFLNNPFSPKATLDNL